MLTVLSPSLLCQNFISTQIDARAGTLEVKKNQPQLYGHTWQVKMKGKEKQGEYKYEKLRMRNST